MKTHKNARDLLPDHLLRELQKYVEGETIYIPRAQTRKSWGEASGARRYYTLRNAEIREKFANGSTLEELAEAYSLSVDSIRKIV